MLQRSAQLIARARRQCATRKLQAVVSHSSFAPRPQQLQLSLASARPRITLRSASTTTDFPRGGNAFQTAQWLRNKGFGVVSPDLEASALLGLDREGVRQLVPDGEEATRLWRTLEEVKRETGVEHRESAREAPLEGIEALPHKFSNMTVGVSARGPLSPAEPLHTVHTATADTAYTAYTAQPQPNAGRDTRAAPDGPNEDRSTRGSDSEKNWLFRTYYKGAVSRGFSVPKDSPPSRHPTLMERETQIREIALVWSRAEKVREREKVHRERQDFKIPVCVGMPGMGKSRLLQEYPRILERAGLTARKTAGICVRYFNGQSMLPADRALDIDVSFAARMLHSAFELDKRKSGLPLQLDEASKWPFQKFLEEVQSTPSLQKQLSIIDVLLAYRAALIEDGFIAKEEELQVVLAVDEYQSLDGDRLKILVDLLLNAYMRLDSFGIHLFPVFAGTEWDKIRAFGSSSPFLRKIPMSFISITSARKMALEIYPEGVENQVFLRHLIALSDIPRQVVEYSKDVSEHSQEIDYESNYPVDSSECVLRENSQNAWEEISFSDSLRVLAYSISGLPVVGSDPSPVKSTSNNEAMTWKQLASRGMLLLEKERYPQVPLSLFMRFASIKPKVVQQTAEEKYFVRSIRNLWKISDQLPDWQKWEQFGAHFLAVKINALRLLGYEEVELDMLFPESPKVEGVTVKLLEAKVVQAQHAISNTTDLAHIPEHNNTGTKYSAFDKKRTIIFVNAENGEGVDFFFALQQTAEQNSYIGFLDQSKLSGDIITKSVLDDWVKGALGVAPSCDELDLRWNVIIANPIGSFGTKSKPEEVIPDHCVVLLRDSLSKYFGPTKHLALPFAAIDVNTCSQAKLQSLLGCSEGFAKIVRKHVEEKSFKSFSELEEFFRRHGKNLPENIREFVLL